MKINFLHTSTGGYFSRRIARSIKWRYDNNRCPEVIETNCLSVNELYQLRNISKEVIHARAAHPNCNWMRLLEEIEFNNTVINSTSTLKLTSDKLASALLLKEKFPNNHPKTYIFNKHWNREEYNNFKSKLPLGQYVVKPYTSMSQGKYVTPFNYSVNTDLLTLFSNIPGNKLVIQQYINYNSISRVIVINGKALPYTFLDKKTLYGDWKVSVCLNKTSMQFNGNPSQEILTLGEEVQKVVNGKISFIDVFSTNDGYVISEINTACNLRIHELLAKKHGRRDWNIHYKIAVYLENEMFKLRQEGIIN